MHVILRVYVGSYVPCMPVMSAVLSRKEAFHRQAEVAIILYVASAPEGASTDTRVETE